MQVRPVTYSPAADTTETEAELNAALDEIELINYNIIVAAIPFYGDMIALLQAASARGMLNGRYVFFYAAVSDDDVVYASPSSIAIENGSDYADRVVLISANPPMASESLMFAAEAPGPVIAYLRSSFGFAPEPAVLARWQDVAGGYQVEARIPANLLGTHLGVNVINTSSEQEAGVRSSSFAGQGPGPFVTTSPDLTSLAEKLVQPGTRMLITDRKNRELAAF